MLRHPLTDSLSVGCKVNAFFRKNKENLKSLQKDNGMHALQSFLPFTDLLWGKCDVFRLLQSTQHAL